jgi:SPP1 gp7 family putative phage head morphogenesis protein
MEHLSISESENNDLQKAFNKAVRWIFKQKKTGISSGDINDKAVQPLLNGINSVLQDGFNHGIEHSVPYIIKRNLSENIYVFSGAKTYTELKELSGLLPDTDGNIKPFNKFWQDAQGIYPEYNRSYLEAEYIFATQSAQMASRWNEYETDGDRYNLQYRTAGDERVRKSHQLLHNTTLSPSDPFWNDYFPPNGWRCRCTAVQVRKSKYPESDGTQAVHLGVNATEGKNNIFRFNPGKQQVIFPEHHPYLKKLSKPDLKEIKKSERKNESWIKIPTENGSVMISSNHGKKEAPENIAIATYLAGRHKYDIELIGRIEGKKTADSFNKTLKITQEYKTNRKATISAIDNEIRSAAKQSGNIVLDIQSDIPEGDLRNVIQDRVKRTKEIESITVIRNNNDKTYTRKDIAKDDWIL